MQPEDKEFYNIVDRLHKGKNIAENERDCYKAKCIELRDENRLLSKSLKTAEEQNATLHNIILHQSNKHKQTKEDLETRTRQLNQKIDKEKELLSEIDRLNKLLANRDSLPESNAKVVELKVVKDSHHKSDVG